MPPRSSPTARRRRLATALRQLREEHQLSCAEVAQSVGWSESKVSRIETGRTGIQQEDLQRLMDLYNVDEEVRSALLILRRQASHRGWWHSYADALPGWFHSYVGLEDGAKSLMIYQSSLVPGIMQTDEYTAAVIRAHHPALETDEINRQVAARATRRSLLTRSEPLQLWTVLDEAVLRRKVGNADMMRAQLHRLRELAALPNVTLQVLPFDAGAHASMGSSFVILRFPDPGDTAIVYLEDLTSSQYLEKLPDIERYTLVSDYLRASALSPEASEDFIRQVAESFT